MTRLPSRAKAGPVPGHHRGADHNQPLQEGVRASALVEVGRELSARPGMAVGRQYRLNGPVDDLLAALVQLDHQAMGIDKPGLAVQDRDGRVVAQNPLVLGVTQFLDTSLLLLEQLGPIHHRRRGAQACIEGTFRTQVGNMGRANHDLRRHTACIDTGTADGAAFDQVIRAPRWGAYRAAAMAAPPLPITAMCGASSSRPLDTDAPAGEVGPLLASRAW